MFSEDIRVKIIDQLAGNGRIRESFWQHKLDTFTSRILMVEKWKYISTITSFMFMLVISFSPILIYGFYLVLLIFSIYLHIQGLIILSVYLMLLLLFH